jgi:hypothetical protein
LAEEGQAKGVVVDTGGEFVRPGEDIGDAEAGAGRLGFGAGLRLGPGLIKKDFFFPGKGGFVVPVGVEVLEKVVGLVVAEEEAGEQAVERRGGGQAVAEAVVAIGEGAEELAVPGAHLFVVAEEVFQPGMQGHFAFIGVDDGGGMAELVVEFHFYVGALPGLCRALSGDAL